MKKSILAFVIGLIFSLIGAICAYIFLVVFGLVGAFANGTIQKLCNVLPFINISTFALSLIGSFFCLSKPKVGGILMLIASITSLICLAILFINLKTFSVSSALLILPSVLILASGIIAVKKKALK